jgi:hypothetical protein
MGGDTIAYQPIHIRFDVGRTGRGGHADRKDRQGIGGAVPAAFEGRTVSVDAVVTRRASALGYPHLRDGLFAATALEHGLTVATRSPASYRSGKVRTFNPWSYSAGADAESGDWRQASRSGPVWLKNLFVRG